MPQARLQMLLAIRDRYDYIVIYYLEKGYSLEDIKKHNVKFFQRLALVENEIKNFFK